MRINKERGIIRLYQVHKDLLSLAFKRVGRPGSSALIIKSLASKAFTQGMLIYL